MSDSLPPVLLLHGVFGRPSLLAPWAERLSSAGYACHAPTMPGRDPTSDAVLRRTGIDDLVRVAMEAYDALDEPPVIVGHSMGGLVGQRLAAVREPAALVLLASIPPGVLWPQLRMLPHLVPVLPPILAGRPFLPSAHTMRQVPLYDLPVAEQDELLPELARDSGRVFREMSCGARSTRVRARSVTSPVLVVSAGEDRNVAGWMSRRLARRYSAPHQRHPGLPHWIVAGSALDRVAPPVLEWLSDVLADPGGRADAPTTTGS